MGGKKAIFGVLNKAMKNDLTKNNFEEVNDHALTSMVDEDKCTQVNDDIGLLRFLMLEFVRLR